MIILITTTGITVTITMLTIYNSPNTISLHLPLSFFLHFHSLYLSLALLTPVSPSFLTGLPDQAGGGLAVCTEAHYVVLSSCGSGGGRYAPLKVKINNLEQVN